MRSSLVWSIPLWAAVAAKDVPWPNKFSQLEDLLYLQAGYGKTAFGDLATPCGFTQGRVQRQTAAEWIRVAFHDMITHDKTAGTGGIDGSILFEIDRVENLGEAFNNTFADFASAFDIRTSLADLIATGLVVAAGNCGEMNIPLRGGRLDATEAGPTGVPEATTDLRTTIDRFSNAGFNQGQHTWNSNETKLKGRLLIRSQRA